MCAGCHAAHPQAAGRARTTCDGPACHRDASAGMKRLVGHRERIAGGRLTGALALIGIAALGLIAGRRLSPPGRPEGGAR